MSLLDRIAHSNGDPQRTIAALRLINAHLAGEMAQRPAHSHADVCLKGWHASDRPHRAEIQPCNVPSERADD